MHQESERVRTRFPARPSSTGIDRVVADPVVLDQLVLTLASQVLGATGPPAPDPR